MLTAGLEPLTDYVNSSQPWPSICKKCKHEVSPTFNNVRQGRGNCKYCSGNAVHPSDVKKVMKAAQLKPLIEFPGAKKAWLCECQICGKRVSPTFSSIKQGGGCKYCARLKVSDKLRIPTAAAIKIMKDAGLLPLEPYLESSKPWKCRCIKCGKVVTPRLASVKYTKSGCAYCSQARVDSKDAKKLFKANGLKPLSDYPGNKKPWPSIHIPCGREVSPSYLAIKRGQGGCKYCSRKAVDPRDAEKIFLQNNLKPLEPYSGNSKKPWRSIHIPCGKEVSPTYNIIQRQESIGCHYCSDQFIDPDLAYQFFIEKDLQPLVPFPGSAKPWKSIHNVCGEIIKPRYGHIKAGRIGCPVCSGNVRITQERAFDFFRSKGLEPQEPFQGPHHPWKCIHTECGKVVTPRWASVQQGQNGCKYCAGSAVDAEDALKLFEKMGLKVLETFPGATKPWRSIHTKCGREVSPRYSALKAGTGPCRYCVGLLVDKAEALQIFRSRGLEPLTEFPGASTGWRSIHKVCGNEVSPYYRYVKMGGVGCNFCSGLEPISPKEVEKLFKSRGFRPLERYQNSKTPIRAIHQVCGREVRPLYLTIKNGGGCKFCVVGGINLMKPGFFYLMTNKELGSHKIGIGGYSSTVNRINQHTKYGWELYKTLDFNTAEEAYEVEQKTLNWIRLELGLPKFLLPEQMPQGGHTETVDAVEIVLQDIWNKAIEFSQFVNHKI